MIMTLLNRADAKFEPPQDGWYQLAPIGNFPHSHGGGVTQIIDAQAVDAIVNSFRQQEQQEHFAGVLVDFDHFSLDTGKTSEAGGWIVDLANRNDGLWAKIRWTDSGEQAVKGGRYRYLSPVWRREDCEDLGNARLRPKRLLNAALTNDPNLGNLRPLTNRSPETKGTAMDPIRARLIEYLSLDPAADDNTILAAMDDVMSAEDIDQLANRVQEQEAVIDTIAAETAKLQLEIANRDLAPFADKLADEDKPFWIDALIANRDTAVRQLLTLTTAAPAPTKRQPLHNRAEAIPPAGITTAAKDADKDDRNAALILNRARAISREQGISFTQAFSRAQEEHQTKSAG